mmetsp:Transcript_53788/g.156841  ORF Transcript_53788/g.156841 Transcript_53788/m.156841 type:complete len:234 (+) Transcript_53788:2001-2702(+)
MDLVDPLHRGQLREVRGGLAQREEPVAGFVDLEVLVLPGRRQAHLVRQGAAHGLAPGLARAQLAPEGQQDGALGAAGQAEAVPLHQGALRPVDLRREDDLDELHVPERGAALEGEQREALLQLPVQRLQRLGAPRPGGRAPGLEPRELHARGREALVELLQALLLATLWPCCPVRRVDGRVAAGPRRQRWWAEHGRCFGVSCGLSLTQPCPQLGDLVLPREQLGPELRALAQE